ncbi:MAG: hypothetical protein KAJ63_09470, partial [Methyloprofundus sp.]|nr:hypothetical protein [Methyloprofundus sp.]
CESLHTMTLLKKLTSAISRARFIAGEVLVVTPTYRTIAGFISFLLAGFGSNLVLELILERI